MIRLSWCAPQTPCAVLLLEGQLVGRAALWVRHRPAVPWVLGDAPGPGMPCTGRGFVFVQAIGRNLITDSPGKILMKFAIPIRGIFTNVYYFQMHVPTSETACSPCSTDIMHSVGPAG